MSVSEKERKHRRWSKSSVASYVTQSAEPIMFLHAVSAFLVSTVYSSLRLDKVCRVGSDWFGNGEVSTSRFCLPLFSSFFALPFTGTSYSEDLCDEIDNGDHDDEQDYVQKTANNLSAAETYAMQVPAFVFIIMAGAWSDKYGNIQRKCKLFLMLLKQHCCRQADHNIPFNTGHAAIKCLCHVQRNILRGNVSGLVAFHFDFWAHWRHQRILCWDVCLCC